MDDAGGIKVPEHLVPALEAWLKDPKPLYGPTVWLSTTYNEDRIMKQIHVDVRLNVGLMPDESNLSVEDVVKLIHILPMRALDPEPLAVIFTDIDTNLIVAETVFPVKDTTKK